MKPKSKRKPLVHITTKHSIKGATMLYEITLYDPETQDTCGTAIVNTEQGLIQEIKDAIHDGYCAIVSKHKKDEKWD